MNSWKVAILAIMGMTLAHSAPLPNCCFEWEVGAAALYWKPCATNFQYANSRFSQVGQPITIQSKQFFLSADYHPGLRLWAKMVAPPCCDSLSVEWTHLDSTDTTSRTRAQVAPADFNFYTYLQGDDTAADLVKAQVKFRYDRAMVRAAHYIVRGRCTNIYLFAGAGWLKIEQERWSRNIIGNTVQIVMDNGRFQGGGLEFGLGGQYIIGCGFSFTGSLGILGLMGDRQNQFKLLTPTDPASQGTEELIATQTACLPGLDFQLGVQFAASYWCMRIAAEIGYELNYYYHPFGLRSPRVSAATLFEANVGFAGPYLAVSVTF